MTRRESRHPSRDRIDKSIDFAHQFRKAREFWRNIRRAGNPGGIIFKKPSTSSKRSQSSQGHHVILRAGCAAYADGTDHLAVDH